MKLSKVVRRTHLFLALFLTPWVLMYAFSSLGMHHREFFTGHHQRQDPEYLLSSDQPFEIPEELTVDPQLASQYILEYLGLTGAHWTRGTPQDNTFIIHRDRPVHSYRLTYSSTDKTLKVEKQRFEVIYFLEMLHRRRGYQQNHLANDAWAVVVDLVIVSIIIWAITGIWMWWRMKKTRRPGAYVLLAGIALFVIFLSIL